MSKEQSTAKPAATGTELVTRKPVCLVEVLGPEVRVIDPMAMVRISIPGLGSVDITAEKHAQNVSKAISKTAGWLSKYYVCKELGIDPTAK
jgi:hypothetical protein